MDILAFLPIGVVTGLISGYFGVGGGAILVPTLLLFGIDMKSAIAISIVQMSMSSVYGTYLNYKKTQIDFKDIFTVIIGGFIGAQGSAYIIANFSDFFLQLLLLVFLLLAMIRISLNVKKSSQIEPTPAILFSIGAFIGLFAISVGVGGALMLIPILVGYFGYSTQKASVTGLFFVLASSLSGVLALSFSSELLVKEGIVTGVGALIGVYFGIKAIHGSSDRLHRNMLLGLYLIVFLIVLYKILDNYF